MSISKSKLHDTLTVTPRAGNGAYGPIYGAEYTANAYVEAGFKRITNKDGQEVVASLFAICAPDFAGSVGDRAAWRGQTYEMIDVQPFSERNRTHHIEVYLSAFGSGARDGRL